MLGRKLMLAVVLIALAIPVGISNELCTDSNISHTFEYSTADQLNKVAVGSIPDEVAVVVDINRLRAMTVAGDNPEFYLRVTVAGENAIRYDEVFEGTDIYFEWPIANLTIPFDEGDSSVPIKIEVWEKNRLGFDHLCDASGGTSPLMAGKTITVFYDMLRGEWTGDDYLGDPSGYGHVSGFEDGNEGENDCEVWFDIYISEKERWWEESDRLTTWETEYIYGLDGSKNYGDMDFNGDGIPMEWEDKYGFDPFGDPSVAEEDPDKDGLTNLEEYKTSQWLSDPFCQDIFIEVDGMQAKNAWGKPYVFPEQSQQLMLNPFVRNNIVVHIDRSIMGGGGDLLPFDEGMDGQELLAARLKYFLNGDTENWKRGVFHYAIICHQMEWGGRPAGGRMCYIDMHTVGDQYVRNWAPLFYLRGSTYYQGFASVFMHELGHTLGLNHYGGIDNEETRFPWNKEFWEWGPYRSCMNYRYTYKLVDFSNGDDDDHDRNDWEVIDLTRFTQPGW